MNAVSLFANVGIAELLIDKKKVNIILANEIDRKRAEIYKFLHKDTNMIVGDILNEGIFQKILDESKKKNIDFLIATPPCQGMSIAGLRNFETDTRNSLITRVFDYIKEIKPKYIFIENVEKQLDTNICYNEENKTILQHFYDLFDKEYYFNEEKILNAKNFEIPQNRKRAIILMSKDKLWSFPKPSAKTITIKDAIGDLPELVPFERESFRGNNKEFNKGHPYHYPPIHAKRHINCMKYTPTGKTAFENTIHYPKKKNGERVKGYNTTYKRMNWNDVAPTITTANGVLSSQCNVHPGTLKKDGLYDNPRVLSLLEIMRLMTIPDNVRFPSNASENLIRKVIGEGIPPLLVKKIIDNLN